jgi:hypothetical protein
MKAKLLFFFLLTLSLMQMMAQNSRVWATYYGGTIYDVGNCAVTDASGNIYLAGYTSSTSGIASGGFQNTYGGGTYDAFLVKLDASGNRLWATYFGNNNNDHAYSIAIDHSGNVYLAGGTSSTTGIASGGFQSTYGGGSYDAFLVKFDASGNRLWATYYGGTGWEEAYGVSTDTAGNVFITGFTNSTAGIASGGFQNSYGGGTYDSFLVKFDAAGNRIWGTYYGGAGDEGYDGNSVCTDRSGNIYLTGWTSSTAGIASGGFQNTSGGGKDAYLVKFNAAGNRVWATYYGGTGDEGGITNILFGKNVATDSSGNVFLSGTTASTSGIALNGFQDTYGGGTYDCYLSKFDSAGNRLWATYYGGSGDERGWGVATDASGNAYLTGRTNSTAGIASGGFQNTNSGNYDAFLAAFSSAGNRLCATYYGGTNGEWVYTPAIDASGNIYLPGFTYSTSGIASGGFQNTFAGGTYDAYLAKFSSPFSPVTGTDVQTACNSFTWIDGNTYTSSNNTATYNIVGGASNGNDSLVTLNLTILNSATGADVQTACNSFTWIDGNIYTSSNNIATYNIAGGAANGCDSLVTLNLTIINSAVGTDVQTACNSFTWIDGNTYTSSNNTATYNIVGGAANGCDSVVTLNLTILNSSTGTDVQTACNSFTWIDGNTYTTSNNTAIYNIIGGAANGCDSLVTLNLTINNVSDISTTTSGIMITANNTLASYQWLDCNNSYAVISGATGQSYTPSANGSYAVELAQNGCTDTSACVNIISVGIADNAFTGQITVYPNPTNGHLSIVSETGFSDALLTVRNAMGQVVYRKNHASSDHLELILDGAPGVYFVEIVDGEKRAILKVIKE